MTTQNRKSHIKTCITALTLLAALPTAHAAAPAANYNKTETSFVSPDAQDFITYKGLAQDSFGNVFLLGTARGYGIDFDPGPGVDNSKGWLKGSTLFITKQNANGSYGGTQLIGTPEPTSYDFANSGYADVTALSVKVDATDNVYILGGVNTDAYFISRGVPAFVDYDPTGNVDKRALTNTNALFLTKLNSRGEYISTSIIEHGISKVISYLGEVVPIPNNLNSYAAYTGYRTIVTSADPLAVKPDGTVYIAGLIGVAGIPSINDLSVIASADKSFDFDPSLGIDKITITPHRYPISGIITGGTLFVTRFNANGSYGNTMIVRGSNPGINAPLITATAQSVYLTGSVVLPSTFTETTVDFNSSPDSVDEHRFDRPSLYLMKLDASNNYAWTRTVKSTTTSSSSLTLHDVAVTSTDDVYLSGSFTGEVDFNPSSQAVAILKSIQSCTFSCISVPDTYLVKLQRDGEYLWSKSLNRFSPGLSGALTTDFGGNVFMTGDFGDDYYVSAFASNGDYGWSKIIGGPAADRGSDILATRNALYVMGSFGSRSSSKSIVGKPIDFNPAAGSDIKIGREDGKATHFLSKYNLAAASNVAKPKTYTLYVSGTPAKGILPIMEVYVDGALAGTFSVKDQFNPTPINVTVNSRPDVTHKVDVVLTNYAYFPGVLTSTSYTNPETRTITVGGLHSDLTTLRVNSPGVTFDAGSGSAAFDGIDVKSGLTSGTGGSNGAWRFTMPATAF